MADTPYLYEDEFNSPWAGYNFPARDPLEGIFGGTVRQSPPADVFGTSWQDRGQTRTPRSTPLGTDSSTWDMLNKSDIEAWDYPNIPSQYTTVTTGPKPGVTGGGGNQPGGGGTAYNSALGPDSGGGGGGGGTSAPRPWSRYGEGLGPNTYSGYVGSGSGGGGASPYRGYAAVPQAKPTYQTTPIPAGPSLARFRSKDI